MTTPMTFTGANVPWDDPDDPTITIDELSAGRIVPGDIEAVQRTLAFLAYELRCVINETLYEPHDLGAADAS